MRVWDYGVKTQLYWCLGLIFLSGCSKVSFESLPPASCVHMVQAHGPTACVNHPSGSQDYDYSVVTGDVDILFVNDNSGSMYTEQQKMANQFPGFLESIHRLSYQIGITSTDVAQGGPGQDGRFFSFNNGSNILRNSSRLMDTTHSQNIPLFQNTIKRSETLDCPNGPSCPSGDERGIYAAVRSLERAENRDFFRPGGHLAFVILSDEDVRSTGGGLPGSEANGGAISASYGASEYDRPETLIQKAKEILPPTKSFSVHSIIIRPGDLSCYNAQNSQGGGVRGYYGFQYAKLSQPTSLMMSMGPIKSGTLGNICSSNYTAEMGQIAQHLKTSDLQLPCTPNAGTFRATYLGPVATNQTEFVNSQNQVQFSPPLEAGTRVRLQFSCN
jgi:hypothetical protein